MSNQKTTLQDILKIMESIPQSEGHAMPAHANDPLAWMQQWLETESLNFDFSRGFEVNRCALYWSGYPDNDGFDGQAFVNSCQDQNGSLRQLAQILDTDLQIFELDPHNPQKPDSDSLALACSYGMMAIEEATQLFCGTVFGAGVDKASDEALAALEKTESFSLETFIENHCGLGHAALLGAAIAATLKGIPFITEGAAGSLVSRIMTRATGCVQTNIIATNDIPALPYHTQSTGQAMVTTAILLKTLYAGNIKTSCGKVKAAA